VYHKPLGAYLSNAARTPAFTLLSPLPEVCGNVGSLFRAGLCTGACLSGESACVNDRSDTWASPLAGSDRQQRCAAMTTFHAITIAPTAPTVPRMFLPRLNSGPVKSRHSLCNSARVAHFVMGDISRVTSPNTPKPSPFSRVAMVRSATIQATCLTIPSVAYDNIVAPAKTTKG
jgi:hypothetical protein